MLIRSMKLFLRLAVKGIFTKRKDSKRKRRESFLSSKLSTIAISKKDAKSAMIIMAATKTT